MNNWDTNAKTKRNEDIIFYSSTEDIAVIAKHLRKLIGNIPGAVFSVRINRQWQNDGNEPRSIIYVEGAIKFWGDDYSDKKQEQSNLMLQGILKDIAEEYQLELNEYHYASRYHLIQHHR